MPIRRFKVDENLPVEIALLLRADGHDALTVGEQLMSGHSDSAVADVCRQEHRVLVTLDLDFGDIRAFPPGEYAGLVILRPLAQDKPRGLNLFHRILRQLGVDRVEKTLWIVDEAGIRVRDET